MLVALINRNALEALAGGTAFHRGEEYFSVGAVGRLRVKEDKVSAKVEGTETYQVELWDEEGELVGDCTCPRAGDGYFCKHCVAVGLAWLDEHRSASSPADGTGRKPPKTMRRDPWKDIRQYLETQPAESLVEVLLAVAQRDDRLFQSLLLKAERTHGGGNAEEAFPDRPHDGLRDFLVAAYLKRKRNDEALQLTWIQFEERPGCVLQGWEQRVMAMNIKQFIAPKPAHMVCTVH